MCLIYRRRNRPVLYLRVYPRVGLRNDNETWRNPHPDQKDKSIKPYLGSARRGWMNRYSNSTRRPPEGSNIDAGSRLASLFERKAEKLRACLCDPI